MAETSRAVAHGLAAAVCLFFSVPGLRAASPQSNAVPSGTVSQRALLNRYCVTCHNERLHTAGLTLDKVDLDDIGGNAEVLEKVLRKLSTGAMPPPGLPRPDKAALAKLSNWLEASLDQAALAKPNPGRVAIHRLNQVEYTNAVGDLLALQIDGRTLLGIDDAGENGFDNMAGALTVSPALVERYLSAARKVSRLAVGDPNIVPLYETYYVPKMLIQEGRTSEDLPFGARGGIAVRHHFAVDGDYDIKIHLRGQEYQYIMGLNREHQIEARLDGKLLKDFTVGGNAPGKPAPSSFAGQIPGDPAWEQYMHDADKGLEVRFSALAGDHVVAVSFVEDVTEPEGVLQPPQMGLTGISYNELYDGYPAVETLSVGGPFHVKGPGDTPSRRAIFVCHPSNAAEEMPCARKIVSVLARRAYRRPLAAADVQTLITFYDSGRKNANFEAGIQSAIQRILVDPEFLFRLEGDPPNVPKGSVYRLTDLELASRLSFFLWSSIPDEELLDLAARDKLRSPGVLEQQVKRMLADPRSKSLAKNFATQWLELPRLRGAAPDPDEYPEFDENLRAAFEQETELFLESQVAADRSVVDLLSANYTFVNERLARHYRIPDVYGESFRPIIFNDGERGGLLGQGSILTVTSYANRTSPVLRGKWLLDNILSMPPPPPPPDVPALKETPDSGGKLASVRQRMEEHRKNPACAVCHVRMDPMGFALENFDAIGQRHDSARDGSPIDVSGTLPDGTKFTGVAGLRNVLLSNRTQFVGAFTEKLLAWSLGRSVEYYDLPALRKIIRDAAAGDYRWSALIEGVVKSTPFQMSITIGPPVPSAVNTTASVTKNTDSQVRRVSK